MTTDLPSYRPSYTEADIIVVLAASPNPLLRSEVATVLGVHEAGVGALLRKLWKEGRIIKTRRKSDNLERFFLPHSGEAS